MKATILTLIILFPIVILFIEFTDFEIDFRSYMLGLGVMWLYGIINMIISTEIENIKFKAKNDL